MSPVRIVDTASLFFDHLSVLLSHLYRYLTLTGLLPISTLSIAMPFHIAEVFHLSLFDIFRQFPLIPSLSMTSVIELFLFP